jgi:hypothetical protein
LVVVMVFKRGRWWYWMAMMTIRTLPALNKGFYWFNEHKQSRDNDCESQLHGKDAIDLS